MKPYPLQLEISGPIALWTRPDTLPNPVSYLSTFQRRLERGRWFYTPCLGWKEFVPDYVGPPAGPKPLRGGEGWFREGTAPCATENHLIPAFWEMVFDQPQSICAN